MIILKPLALSLTLLGALAASPAFAEVPQKAPEIATAYAEKSGWAAQKFMVAAANPLAADAGYQMLKKGGSAIDAAIATQLVLTLVEPQSSGIGGGAFLLYSTAKGVQAFDGRETAPASADEHLFQNADGSPVSRATGVVGGRSVGAPGVLRMLELAHKEHGKLPWATLFGPAIKLAHGGFPVSQRLNGLLNWDQALKRDPVAAAYFYDPDGKAWPVGHVLKNPQLARTLREIARGGADAFYNGRIARDIAAKVAAHPTNPGKLTAQDIAGYRAKVREPVCSDYKAWTVCGMPPPSSGGIAIAQMLGMLEVKDIRPYAPVDGVLDAQAIHLFSEAGRLAYADRNRYVADTDFVPLPGNGVASMLDKTYLAQRASLIGDKSMGKAMPGTPPGMQVAWGMDNALQRPSTSHLVAVDAFGGGLSMTTSVEDAFGSRQMVDGFLLNNQLTDFSFDSRDADGPIANRVEAGKRPRSAMSPTLVFEKGTHKLVLATGSPGGSSIINYVAKVLVGTMDWGLNVQQAISLPNFGSRNGPTELEKGRAPAAQVEALQAMGHEVRVIEQNSGLQGIMRLNAHGKDFWFGGADPRREGMVKGD
ncbi:MULTISPECIES: gamma-glutamyltransferase [unclassified Janthinobacterium]|uniref:gamma-glutamyltransferase n=1 Tax=unclassified Janthinobacterium TaxID=2610881 RepID=UPI002712E4E9|nr:MULTISPECIES: gamma-glutamyltransferase [unclassified Janthinobacterium]MDO8069330.1 gamma-glutamyltransferase [Janthinobacterium sp. SUN206]MDO8075236.1 gamma-glutamyltransferase [Janthinobacterium sp. SUN176]MED5615535.1 gamma-glutamyltransferase [Janthinobacterium sp. P210005]